MIRFKLFANKYILACLGSLTLMSFVFAATQTPVYALGDKALGGTVFFLTASGEHGLVSANTDQGKTYMARGTDFCSDVTLFDEEGQAYTDWKMPTGTQLKLMYEQKDLIGQFKTDRYWAVSGDMLRNFRNGTREYDDFSHDHLIRCIRHF